MESTEFKIELLQHAQKLLDKHDIKLKYSEKEREREREPRRRYGKRESGRRDRVCERERKRERDI